ncbi:hypothetical protein AVEN_203098-1 [Araneus ventricosus]|uniref:Uncharacterized protein n=1 Tax=Araneus ventricosus TaxID=182803 RepID=A0A4Y2DPT1_ARAVE|nr:hypothetical protein AVEN_203098-1 [Araneus ventricosus]
MNSMEIEKHNNEASRDTPDNRPHCSDICPKVMQVFYTFREEGRKLMLEPLFHCITHLWIVDEELIFQDFLSWTKHMMAAPQITSISSSATSDRWQHNSYSKAALPFQSL